MLFRLGGSRASRWAQIGFLVCACQGHNDDAPSATGGSAGAGAGGAGGFADGGRSSSGGSAGSGGLAATTGGVATSTGGASAGTSGGHEAGGAGRGDSGGSAGEGTAGGGSAGSAGSGESGGAAGEGGADSGEGGAGGAGGAGGTSEACPSVAMTTNVTEFDVGALHEASGLTASRTQPGVFYTHNDSGSPPVVFAVGEDGELRATIELAGALNQDWEDIAMGPGPEAGKSYVYVGDIGDNDSIRTTSILVERFLEPDLSGVSDQASLMPDFDNIYLHYPDGPHNAETLLVDAETADIYVVTKGDTDGSRVYVAPAPQSTSVVITLDYLGSLPLGTAPFTGSALATGGSVAADGSAVLLRTYDTVFLLRRARGQTLAEALFSAPCAFPAPEEGKGEGITFGADASSYFTLGEGDEPTLNHVSLTNATH